MPKKKKSSRRISIMIPVEVLDRLEHLADKEGIGYQTLANRILRDATLGESSMFARLDRLEKAVLSPAPSPRDPRR